MKRCLPFIIVGAAALTALASGPLLCQTMQMNRLTIAADETISGKGLAKSVHIRGNPEAPVTLEEFGDFECSSCANLATFLDQLIKEYHPRVRLIFLNFPLPMHQFARDAALTAEAAGLQGRYWEMHDLLYREQAVWAKTKDVQPLFDSYAGMIGVNLERFKKDVGGEQVKAKVESDQKRGEALGVKNTPTIFINNQSVPPASLNPTALRAAIDAAVKEKDNGS